MSEARVDVAATGIPGLDDILRGGLPRRRIYLLHGEPGAGKTTVGLQFLLEGKRLGESCLYVTLSETEEELLSVASSHDWDLRGIAVHQLSSWEEMQQAHRQNTLFHPSEVELNETTAKVLELVERIRPQRIVFDSLSEMRLLAGDSLRYRRQILALKQFFAGRNSTVLFLDDGTAGGEDLQLYSLAHGVLRLEKIAPEYGAIRQRLEVVKLRGVSFRNGRHDYTIERGGLRVYPRLIAAEHHKAFAQTRVSSGLPQLDQLLGGGLDQGTSTLLLGPAGVGKSNVAGQYIHAAIERSEKVTVFSFDENRTTFFARSAGVGLDLRQAAEVGALEVRQVDPGEISPGEFSHLVRQAVEQHGSQLVVIDSLNGYLMAMPNDQYLLIQMHELLTYLSQKGVTTLMTVAQHGLVGNMQAPIDVTYLADSVVLFRFFEAAGRVRKAISVLKKRAGAHENTIREFQVTPKGLSVGAALTEFRGVLSGTPVFEGPRATLLKDMS